MKKSLLIISSILICSIIFAQDAKVYYKTALDLMKNKKYNEAVEYLSKSIEMNPAYSEAYTARAESYEEIGEFQKAADDYNKLTMLDKTDETSFYNAGRLYLMNGEYDKAIENLKKAIALKNTLFEAYPVLTRSYLKAGKYDEAKNIGQEALSKKNTAENNQLYGLTLYKKGDIVNAEQYLNTAIKKDNSYMDAYYDLAKIKNETNKYDEALSLCNQALQKNSSDARFYVLRSSVYKNKMDKENALNDISKAIIIAPDVMDYFYIKGTYFKEFNQYSEAITQFNKVLHIDKNNLPAMYERAQCYEKVGNMDDAKRDFLLIAEYVGSDPYNIKITENVKEKIFELNKESNKPEVKISSPRVKSGNVLIVPVNKKEISISGDIADQSDIKELKINGNNISINKKGGQYEFSTVMNISGIKNIKIEASDVYNNMITLNYTIKLAEANAPKISILSPYSSDNKIIYLSTTDPSLYIQGKVTDESKISKILIDGVSPVYNNELNPVFSSTVNVNNKQSISIKAVDEVGNETIIEYTLNREGAINTADNPMGKTWVVFIENSLYKNFPSLDGPSKDVSSMQTALSNYQIHNIIYKKNLTKVQMENFFNIELRDLVRANQVNSILIWYSGHGKLVNEKGYWIPVDAERDDEFSFFDITNLKASMQLYSKNITHLLLVTDACESGSSFYQAMRGRPVKQCDDYQATRFKSSQIFASTGYELAIDNSQFTKTFVTTLSNNTDSCIPIEKIVNKVTEAATSNNQRSPIFGKIVGLEDENGTFFFITK